MARRNWPSLKWQGKGSCRRTSWWNVWKRLGGEDRTGRPATKLCIFVRLRIFYLQLIGLVVLSVKGYESLSNLVAHLSSYLPAEINTQFSFKKFTNYLSHQSPDTN
jgi:hypothetical protein